MNRNRTRRKRSWHLEFVENRVHLSESVKGGWDHAERANPSHCPPSVPASQRDTHQGWWRRFRPKTQSHREWRPEWDSRPPAIYTNVMLERHPGLEAVSERLEMEKPSTCYKIILELLWLQINNINNLIMQTFVSKISIPFSVGFYYSPHRIWLRFHCLN